MDLRPCVIVHGTRIQVPDSAGAHERNCATVGTCPLGPVNSSCRGHGWRMCQGKLVYGNLNVGLNGYDAQVYTLEKVLKLKKDPISQIVFLDEAMKVGSIVSLCP